MTRHVVIQWLPENTKMRRYVALSRIVKTAHKYFFLRRFNSTKHPSNSLGKEDVSNLAGLSSYVESYWKCIPFNSELIRRKCKSNFVSEIINISKLPLMLFESISNLFSIEFMFMLPIINLLILAMRVVFNLLRKDVLSLLSSFSFIKVILSVDDCSRQEYIWVFRVFFLASEDLYSQKSVR